MNGNRLILNCVLVLFALALLLGSAHAVTCSSSGLSGCSITQFSNTKCSGNNVLRCSYIGLDWGIPQYCWKNIQTCGSGYACSSGACVCNSTTYACYDNDVYKYACGTRQSMSQDCGNSGYTGSKYCSGNNVVQDYYDKGCSSGSCYSKKSTKTILSCSSGYVCQSGACVQDCGSDTYTYKCDSGKLYYFNKCNVKKALKQDCGTNSTGSWGANYCKNNNVYKQRTNYSKGCSGTACYSNPTVEESLVQTCAYGCTSGACIASPTVTITSVTSELDNHYLGSVVWETSSLGIKETGIQTANRSDKSDAIKVSASLNSTNKYGSMLIPKKNMSYVMYVRAYVTGTTGTTVYTDWKSITVTLLSCYGTNALDTLNAAGATDSNDLDYGIDGINLAEFGIDAVKFFTIGSCIDDGWLTMWCAYDLGSTALFVVPEAGATAKIGLLAKGSKILKAAGSTAKLGKIVKVFSVTFKGAKYEIVGSKIAKWAEKGILKIDFSLGKITAKYPKLSEFLFKGSAVAESKVDDLLAKGATNDVLEGVILKNGDLAKTIKASNNAKGVFWLEEGTASSGWTHITTKHITPGDFRNAGIADNAVQDTVFKSVSSPTKTMTSKAGNGFCYILEGVAKYPIVTVVGSNGYIVTSYPESNIAGFVCN